ncbi:hypothetical protein [Cerasicoccus arenae]|nr:hypothetical protein [Cerasicoccus arenae]
MFGFLNNYKNVSCILAFLVGATMGFDVTLIGRVAVAELIIALSIIPLFMWRKWNWFNANFYRAFALICLWVFGVMICDLINGTPFFLFLRSAARPVFVLLYVLFFIGVLSQNPRSILAFAYGNVITGVVKYFRPSSFESEVALDVGSYAGIVFRVTPMVLAISIALAILVYQKSKYLSSLALLLGGVAMVLVGGARSTLLIMVLSSAVMLFLAVLSGSRRRFQMNFARKSFLCAIAATSLVIIYGFYVYAAPKGMLGDDQQQKFENQRRTVFGVTPLGFFLSGRPQVYAAMLGIVDKPILGFGSWRQDLTSYYLLEAISSLGTDAQVIDRLRSKSLKGGAGHSVLFQTWVENGLIAAMCVIAIGYLSVRVFAYYLSFDNPILAFIIPTMAMFFWDYFFSPPSISVRFTMGFVLASYVVYMDRSSNRNKGLLMALK